MSKDYLYDDRAPAFRMLADGAKAMAAHHGVEVDDTTYHRWSDAGGLMRETDSLHDDGHVPADELIARLQTYDDEFGEIYPHLAPSATGPEINAELLGIARSVFMLGALAARTTSPDDYAVYRHAESVVTAGIVTKTATPEVMAQPGYHKNFVPEFETLTVGLTFMDSYLDAWRDYRDGAMQVKPDLAYFRALRRVGRPAIVHSVKIIARPPMTRLAFAMGRQRIRTRLDHGLTDYSTMQNLPAPLKRLWQQKNVTE
ncbi:MAG TPA: hypothetical protein VF597_00235 [Candidatus Saccharimonadales bacterium]|jgi:hypothetical protein